MQDLAHRVCTVSYWLHGSTWRRRPLTEPELNRRSRPSCRLTIREACHFIIPLTGTSALT